MYNGRRIGARDLDEMIENLKDHRQSENDDLQKMPLRKLLKYVRNAQESFHATGDKRFKWVSGILCAEVQRRASWGELYHKNRRFRRAA